MPSFATGSMRTVLATPEIIAPAEDTANGGTGLRPGLWKPPTTISTELADEARAAMRDFNADAAPPAGGYLTDWLLDLLDGTAHGMTPDALGARCRALMEGIEDYPRRCFTKATRKVLRRQFSFVPTAKELIDAIDAIDQENREAARRCMAIIDGAAKPKPKREDDDEPWHQRSDFGWSKDAAEEHGRRLRARDAEANRQLAAKMAADRGEQPVPIRQPGESDEMFMARLKQHRDDLLGHATEVMKRPVPVGRAESDKRRSRPSTPQQLGAAISAMAAKPASTMPARPDIAERAKVTEPADG